jgi:hypothetical protein
MQIAYCNWEGKPCLVAKETDEAWAFDAGEWKRLDRIDAGQNARVIGRAAFLERFGTQSLISLPTSAFQGEESLRSTSP